MNKLFRRVLIVAAVLLATAALSTGQALAQWIVI